MRSKLILLLGILLLVLTVPSKAQLTISGSGTVLPSCSNGEVITYDTTSGLWDTCAANGGSSGVTGSGTSGLLAVWSGTNTITSGYKLSRGSTSLDGSNPTTVATGLTTVVSCTGTLLRSTALTGGTAFLTHATASGANVDWYGWILAGTASTDTETFEWICIGT